VKKCWVTFDSQKEDAFIVHPPSKTIKYKRSNDRLYYYKPTEILYNNVKFSSLENNINSTLHNSFNVQRRHLISIMHW